MIPSFDSRLEQRQVCETYDAVLQPLIQYLNKETGDRILRGLEILHSVEVKENAIQR